MPVRGLIITCYLFKDIGRVVPENPGKGIIVACVLEGDVIRVGIVYNDVEAFFKF